MKCSRVNSIVNLYIDSIHRKDTRSLTFENSLSRALYLFSQLSIKKRPWRSFSRLKCRRKMGPRLSFVKSR